jgi:HEAT repeat protein
MRSGPVLQRLRAGMAAALAAAAVSVVATGCGGGGASGGLSKPSQRASRPPVEAYDAIRLGELRERVIGILVEATKDPSAEVRANAVEGLAVTPSRLKPLLPTLLADQNLGVRAVAAMAVGKARITAALPHVRPLVYDPSPIVKAAAVFALRRCGDTSPDADPTPIGALLWDDSPRTRAHAAYLLGELRESSALPMLIDSLRAKMPRARPAEVRLMELQIAEARAKLGDDNALHPIRAALYPSRPDDLEATALAAQIIGEVNDRRSIDQLVYLTARLDETGRHMPAEIRLAAAASLAKLGLPRGSFLAEEYLSDPKPTLRAQAALLLGAIGHTDGLRYLQPMLEDPNPQVRVAAAAAILRITERAQPEQ